MARSTSSETQTRHRRRARAETLARDEKTGWTCGACAVRGPVIPPKNKKDHFSFFARDASMQRPARAAHTRHADASGAPRPRPLRVRHSGGGVSGPWRRQGRGATRHRGGRPRAGRRSDRPADSHSGKAPSPPHEHRRDRPRAPRPGPRTTVHRQPRAYRGPRSAHVLTLRALRAALGAVTCLDPHRDTRSHPRMGRATCERDTDTNGHASCTSDILYRTRPMGPSQSLHFHPSREYAASPLSAVQRPHRILSTPIST